MIENTVACHLSHRGVLRISGDDRRNFLQGLISNDIHLCTGDKSIYAALLTPQGKFLHEMFVYDADDCFLIDCEKERADDLVQRLNTYKLRAKVSIENVSDDFKVWAFPKGGTGFVDPRLSDIGKRGIFEKQKSFSAFQILDDFVYNQLRLALGLPEGSRDMMVGKSTLSDGNFDLLNGISWTKGCYVGQELTARMHHRALVKKRMFPVKISGAAPTAGTILYFDDQEIGEMRSSNGAIGIALLNIELAKLCFQGSGPITAKNCQLLPTLPGWLKL